MHRACAENQSDRHCRWCQWPIDEGYPYYVSALDKDPRAWHEECLEEEWHAPETIRIEEGEESQC